MEIMVLGAMVLHHIHSGRSDFFFIPTPSTSCNTPGRWMVTKYDVIFSEGYRRYLALCLTSSVSQLVSAFLFFKTHIRVLLDYVES